MRWFKCSIIASYSVLTGLQAVLELLSSTSIIRGEGGEVVVVRRGTCRGPTENKTMRLPKGKLLALVALVLAASMVMATGAFTTVQAERNVNVEVAGDDQAFLALEPSDQPNGAYATQTGQGELELNFNSEADVTGQGVNPDSVSSFDNVFMATNQGTQEVIVTANSSAQAVTIYPTDGSSDTARQEMSQGDLTIPPGETVYFGVQIDATDQFQGATLAGNDDDITITAVATEQVNQNGG